MHQSESQHTTSRTRPAILLGTVEAAFGLFLLLSSLLLCGCSKLIIDSWNDPPPDSTSFKETDIRFFLVKEDQLPRAIKLLESTSFLEIDPELFAALIGVGEKPPATAFLARAVCYAFNPTGFRFYSNSDSVWIFHGALSTSRTMYRYALVIVPERRPTKVFVSCRVAK